MDVRHSLRLSVKFRLGPTPQVGQQRQRLSQAAGRLEAELCSPTALEEALEEALEGVEQLLSRPLAQDELLQLLQLVLTPEQGSRCDLAVRAPSGDTWRAQLQLLSSHLPPVAHLLLLLHGQGHLRREREGERGDLH